MRGFFSFDKVGDHAVVNRVAEVIPLLIFVRWVGLSRVKVDRHERYGYRKMVNPAKGDRSNILWKFFWSPNSQRQRVESTLELICEGSIHHPVALEGTLQAAHENG